MERKKNEVKARGDSKEKRKERKEYMDRIRQNQNRGIVVEVGQNGRGVKGWKGERKTEQIGGRRGRDKGRIEIGKGKKRDYCEGEKKRKEKMKEIKDSKVVFWNVARLGRKGKDFWKGLKNGKLVKTWTDEKGWMKEWEMKEGEGKTASKL